MGAGAGKRVVAEDGGDEIGTYKVRPCAGAAAVVSVLPKSGGEEGEPRAVDIDVDETVTGRVEQAPISVKTALGEAMRRGSNGSMGEPATQPRTGTAEHERSVRSSASNMSPVSPQPGLSPPGHNPGGHPGGQSRGASPLPDLSPRLSAGSMHSHDSAQGPTVLGAHAAGNQAKRPVGVRAGQTVQIVGLAKAVHLNGQSAVAVYWDSRAERWVIRLSNGDEKRIRAENLTPVAGTNAHAGGQQLRSAVTKDLRHGGSASPTLKRSSTSAAGNVEDANKELEALLLQTNWSAIYQIFHQRYGVAALDKDKRCSIVKSAVEMTLSIVAKCYALLRSDPSGRLHCTPLHIAALQSSSEAAEVIVRDLPGMVEQTHKPSHSALCPLHIAILTGTQDIVELLLEGKANPNVRTLHDICPLHIAATTSKELCQLLIQYSADVKNRDVMGSTAFHYATAFRQQMCLEVMANSDKGAQYAVEADQKKVTPLHIACALYTSPEDLVAPMILMANGAKPWQTDRSGASARELVPWSYGSELQKFFETSTNREMDDARLWYDERKQVEEAEQENAQADLQGETEMENGEGPTSARPAMGRKGSMDSMAGPEQHVERHSTREQVLLEEAEDLRKELATCRDKLQAMGELEMELSAAKTQRDTLEQSLQNKQSVIDDMQALNEQTRSQCKEQLEEMRQRTASERTEWEAWKAAELEAAQQEFARQLEAAKKEFEQQREDYQTQLQKAEEAVATAEAASEQLRLNGDRAMRKTSRQLSHLGATRTPKGISLDQVGEQAMLPQEDQENPSGPQPEPTPAPTPAHASAGSGLCSQCGQQAGPAAGGDTEKDQMIEELQQNLAELEEQAGEFQMRFEQERLISETVREKLEDIKASVRSLTEKHARQGEESFRATQFDLFAPLDTEFTRLKGDVAGREADVKALQEQIVRQQEEVTAYRSQKAEAEDRMARLQADMKEVESSAARQAVQLQAKLKDLEIAQSQEVVQARGELEVHQKAREQAEARALELQPQVDSLHWQLRRLEEQFAEEQRLRKKFHNQIQDMKGAIRVFCRFRPMVKREKEAGERSVLQRKDAFTVALSRPAPHNDEKQFQFDSVFDPFSTQEDIFSDCRELIQSAVDGYNVTIFAYGQTGAGKTHTMYGNAQQQGLAPRAIHEVFNVIARESRTGNKSFKVKTYMVEVYKQDIIDLLAPLPSGKDKDAEVKKKGLEIKRDPGHGMVYVEGVNELAVSNPEELKAALAEGEKRRHVAATKMNSASSRSHLLLTLVVQGNVKDTGQVIHGKITLVDLAGSERPKKSEVTGEALKEAIEINKSLTSLGDVIEALTKGSKTIPYRNHKLTMLMQDSLGGTAKTLMFVNCSPAGSNHEETQMSLKWAARARQVTNDVKRNADSKEVARLKQVIAMMSQAQNATEAPRNSDTPHNVE